MRQNASSANLQMTTKLGRVARRSCCHPEGPQQAEETGQHEPHEVQYGEVQSAAPEKEQPYAPVHAGGTLVGKQLGRKGSLIDVYKYQKGGCKEDRASLVPVVPSARTGGNGHKLKHKRISLNTRKHFFTVRVTEHWHRLPRELLESPSLEKAVKSCLDMVLGNWL